MMMDKAGTSELREKEDKLNKILQMQAKIIEIYHVSTP